MFHSISDDDFENIFNFRNEYWKNYTVYEFVMANN